MRAATAPVTFAWYIAGSNTSRKQASRRHARAPGAAAAVYSFKAERWVMSKVKACEVNELAVGSVTQVALPDGALVALYRLEDGFFATDDVCSHGAAYLSEGDVEDGNIVCPFHGGTFDIKTGDPTGAPCVVPIRTFSVIVEDDTVYIGTNGD